MKKLKYIFKHTSPYLLFLAIVETIISVICTVAFVYSDTLSYQQSEIFQAIGIEKLLESIYSSTWWALILLLLALIAVLTISTVVLRKMDYFFISILLWFEMMILAFDLNKPINELVSIIALFIPIIIINIIAYNDQSKKLKEIRLKKKNKASN